MILSFLDTQPFLLLPPIFEWVNGKIDQKFWNGSLSRKRKNHFNLYQEKAKEFLDFEKLNFNADEISKDLDRLETFFKCFHFDN